MMKYIGTSTISKNTKKRMRSRLRKTPSNADSSTSIHIVYDFRRSLIVCDAISPIGKSSAVRATMNRLMPSTPTR